MTEPAMHAPRLTLRGSVALAAAFFVACTAFGAAITAVEAWEDLVQSRWPAATAHIKSCGVKATFSSERYVSIECSVRFVAGGEPIEAVVTSRKLRTPKEFYFRWPENQVGEGDMQSWVDGHPESTPIQVRYDPAQHARVVVADSDMPLGGARTPGNVRIVGMFAAISALSLAIGLFVRRR